MSRPNVLAALLACGLAGLVSGQEEICDTARSEWLEKDARRALGAREYPVASRRFQEALDACPTNRSLLLGLSQAQLYAREFEDAIRSARQYLITDSASVAARLLIANSYFMSQRLKEAQAEAGRILQERPDEPTALKIKANAAYLLGSFPEAKDTLIRLLERHPDDEDAAYMLGRIYYQEGYIELATGQFERVLKRNPAAYKAYDNLGLCYQAAGDTQRALGAFLAAIKLVETDHPEYEWPYTNLADLLLKQDDAKRAYDAASKAVNRNPMSARGFYIGAKALDQLGKPELSLNWVQRSVALDPQSSASWYLLSRVYRELGQTKESKEAEQKFKELKAKEPSRRR